MAIVDSLSSPDTYTTFDSNANFHIFFTYTGEDNQAVTVTPRYVGFTSKVEVSCNQYGTNDLLLAYNDGTFTEVATVNQVFTSDIEYRVDIYGNGSNIIVEVNGSGLIDETVTYNQAQTGSRIEHSLSTNDIELESWPYGEPSTSTELVIADASLALSADGSGSVDGLWDLGAYIYTSGSGIVLEVGGVDVLLAIANASLALSSESPALGPALLIANASLALSSENVVFQSSVSIDANRIARIIFVMKNG